MQANSASPARPGLILFDVYETLLDMGEIEKRLNTLIASRRGYTVWIELFMQYCFVDNCTAQFNDFSSIAKATMQMAGRLFNRTVTDDDLNNVLVLLEHLPVHEGVQQGLSELNDQGFRVAALTNSAEKTVRTRMEATGLISYFEVVLCAEHIKKYKPCTEVYEWAANSVGLELKDILLVSAHGWDIAGAVNAGMQTAYLEQPRQMLYPLAPHPTYIVKDLPGLSGKMKAL